MITQAELVQAIKDGKAAVLKAVEDERVQTAQKVDNLGLKITDLETQVKQLQDAGGVPVDLQAALDAVNTAYGEVTAAVGNITA